MSKEQFIPREKAPFISMGFRIGSGEDLCVIDFLDMPADNITKVEASVALTKKQAVSLIESLEAFINKD
jgi:hypothetical protein